MSDAVAPLEVVDAIGPAREKKAHTPAWQLVLRAILATYLLGAATTLAVDWWLWNQIPALVGNFIGGITLAALGLYYSHRTPARTPEEIDAES